MVTLTAGTVALVPFPFSDLSQAKLRPAIVLANVGRHDWILCQVTSNSHGDESAIEILTPTLTEDLFESSAMLDQENFSQPISDWSYLKLPH